MKGIASIEPAGFLADFQLRLLWTARLVRQFSDADLSLTPAEGSMTTAQQIHQICTSNNFLSKVLSTQPVDGSAFKREFNVTTVDEALRSLLHISNEVKAALETMPAEAWTQEIEPFGPAWRMTRGQVAYLMMEHEAHHRGQLTVYLRIAGKTPPVLYEPVDETAIFLGID